MHAFDMSSSYDEIDYWMAPKAPEPTLRFLNVTVQKDATDAEWKTSLAFKQHPWVLYGGSRTRETTP